MDLGLQGRWALVCAASKGLGKGCAKALVAEGVNVVITARGAEALEATAAELRALNAAVQVRTVVGDIATPANRAAALAACPQVDILVNNAGGPPPGDFRDWTRDDWIKAVDANMLTPIELIKATVDGMAERGFGRIVNITSGAVKAPIDVLGLSNGARSGLTGFVAGAGAPVAAGRAQRHHQQPAAGRLRHRPHPHHHARYRRKRAARPRTRSLPHAWPRCPRPPPGNGRRIRRHVRLPVQRARRLHHRSERADGRRRLPGHVLTHRAAGLIAGSTPRSLPR
jgi:NADP-dependent 3-hydroxy acid dehydrogenase YdfG